MDARGELCTGQKCAQFERCFITDMQRRALASDIILVNPHLFFADLAVKENDFASIIPDYEAVVFDEAHELEDVAGQYFGLSVSNFMIDDLRKDILSLARRKNLGTPDLDRVLIDLQAATERFFACFPAQEGRTGFQRRAEFVRQFEDVYQDLLSSLEITGVQLQMIRESMDEVVPLFGRARSLQESLKQYLEGVAEDFVYWIVKFVIDAYVKSIRAPELVGLVPCCDRIRI